MREREGERRKLSKRALIKSQVNLYMVQSLDSQGFLFGKLEDALGSPCLLPVRMMGSVAGIPHFPYAALPHHWEENGFFWDKVIQALGEKAR